jgi:hypothetical protein
MKDKLTTTEAIDEMERQVLKQQIKQLIQKAKSILRHEV